MYKLQKPVLETSVKYAITISVTIHVAIWIGKKKEYELEVVVHLT